MRKFLVFAALVVAVVLFVEFGGFLIQGGIKVGDKVFQGMIGGLMQTVQPQIEVVIPRQGA